MGAKPSLGAMRATNLVLGISSVENRSSDCSEDMQKQLDAAETP